MEKNIGNMHPKTSKEFDDMLNTFNIENREPTSEEVKIESAVKQFISTRFTDNRILKDELAEMKITRKTCTHAHFPERKTCFKCMKYNQALQDIEKKFNLK